MTVQDILDELDDHGFADVSSARKLVFLNSVYKRVCAKALWPFLQTEATSTIASQALTMPLDWAKTKALNLYDTTIGTTDIAPLKVERYDFLRKNFWDLESSANASRPLYYYFKGNTINVYPVPDKSYSVIHTYFKTPATLSAGDAEGLIVIPPRYHESVLVPGTLVKLYAMEDDTELAAEFRNDFNEAYFDMFNDLMSNQVDKPDHIYYTDIDEYTY